MEMNEQMNKSNKRSDIAFFISRLIGYIILGLVIPMSFLIWRFDLFSKTSKLNIGGWGVVVIIFTAVFIAKLAKQACEAIDNVFAKQIVDAVRKVLIPLLAATLCLYAVGDFWKELVNFFIALTICEPIAYVLNPFPEFLKEKEKEEKKSNLVKVLELFWEKKK